MPPPSGSETGRVAGGHKVGRKPAFTAADAVEAALAEGIDRFTLSAVAERLGVVPTALYRLFPTREDLVIASLDAAGATIELPRAGAHWRDVLELWADECWRVCEEYPGLSRLVYSYPLAPTRILRVYSAYTEALAAHGKTPGQAMFAIGIIADTVFASHWSVEAMRSTDAAGRSGLDAVRQAIRDGEQDAPFRPRQSWTTRDRIATKVAFVLTGLQQYWPEA